MTDRKSKSKKTSKQLSDPKNPTHDNAKSVTIDLPSDFPFKDLICAKEHKGVFKSLFGDKI